MIPRLHIDAPLAANGAAPLSAAQIHYLCNVLRREIGAEIRVFNARDGEFLGRLAQASKKGGAVAILEKRRSARPSPPLTLAFAPVKRTPTEYIVQKGTELGVACFQPVVTARTNADKVNLERLKGIATEASEQCERFDIPEIRAPLKLSAFLGEFDSGQLIFCDEAGDDPGEIWGGQEGRAAPFLHSIGPEGTSATILIGPEGGFTPKERQEIRAHALVRAVTLGPRILRADTAAMAAVVLWQGAAGDFRRN